MPSLARVGAGMARFLCQVRITGWARNGQGLGVVQSIDIDNTTTEEQEENFNGSSTPSHTPTPSYPSSVTRQSTARGGPSEGVREADGPAATPLTPRALSVNDTVTVPFTVPGDVVLGHYMETSDGNQSEHMSSKASRRRRRNQRTRVAKQREKQQRAGFLAVPELKLARVVQVCSSYMRSILSLPLSPRTHIHIHIHHTSCILVHRPTVHPLLPTNTMYSPVAISCAFRRCARILRHVLVVNYSTSLILSN
eukprot:TRINITY_DN1501_c0_g2_i5.p1 TRINITY_DN1501_c0_g2~~TRINITY_DN1501_c0_g2_i5.p1  ORF type:complete len:267 (+),score=-2.23 TRINITY_DN1501_c0_g2_i5:47-802(+)